MTALEPNAEIYRTMGEIVAGLAVVTHNVKHFSHIKDLEIEDWIK